MGCPRRSGYTIRHGPRGLRGDGSTRGLNVRGKRTAALILSLLRGAIAEILDPGPS